ncbi:Dolichyl-P-Man Man [Zea mays]|uniref:Mannosyltransferase n=1 Tax=Zea mays TaxID=4577 RepID=A0A1D6E4B2_MAIZE|nr:Dolichyl-P-Man Man [Zea mays]
MPRPKPAAAGGGWLSGWGWDLMLGSIAAFYAVMAPYTKVEESFNVQAIHDILYHTYHIEKYDHLEFPGVVPRTFIGAFVISILSSPTVFVLRLLRVPKFYSLLTVRLTLSCVTLMSLRLLRVQVKKKFGHQAEAFFVVLTAIQFHLLFYSSRPLPNIFALALVNLAYSFWFKGSYLCTLRALVCLMPFSDALPTEGSSIVAAVVFRCDMILLLGPIGLALLLSRSVSLLEAIKCCISTTLVCIGFTVLIDSIMWRRILWPEFQVLWFNSVLNRSSEWGTHSIHWYFTSALPRSMIVAYPLCMLWVDLQKHLFLNFHALVKALLNYLLIWWLIFTGEVSDEASPFNFRYNNRKKAGWNLLFILMLGAFLVSLGYSTVTFMASYNNYPGGYALKALHEADSSVKEKMVHIDAFTAMSGVSRFCENEYPWRYSKEEEIPIEEFEKRNFTYLLNEHRSIGGYQCLFAVDGFSRVKLTPQIPPLSLVKEPKVFAHGNTRDPDILSLSWPGCP